MSDTAHAAHVVPVGPVNEAQAFLPAIAFLESLPQHASSSFSPVLSVLTAWIELEAGGGVGPPLMADWPAYAHFRHSLQMCLEISLDVLEAEPHRLVEILNVVNALFPFYTFRVAVAVAHHGRLDVDMDLARDTRTHFGHIIRLAVVLYGRRDDTQLVAAIDIVASTVAGAIFCLAPLQQFSNETRWTFYSFFQGPDSWNVLALMYTCLALDASPPSNDTVPFVWMLAPAEIIAIPSQVPKLQDTYLEQLVITGQVSRSYVSLSPEQLCALRPPSKLWDALSVTCWRENCGKCSLEVRRCSRCKRVFYCSETCQVVHWEANHKRYCKIWVAIALEGNRPEIQAMVQMLNATI